MKRAIAACSAAGSEAESIAEQPDLVVDGQVVGVEAEVLDHAGRAERIGRAVGLRHAPTPSSTLMRWPMPK